MPIVDDYEGNKSKFEVPKPGTYRAIIGGGWDVGLQETKYGTKRMMCLAYELDERGTTGKRYIVFGVYKITAHPMSSARPVIDAALGKLGAGERKSLDLPARLVGSSLMVNVIINDMGKAKIDGVSPLMRGLEPLDAEGKYDEAFGLASWMIDNALGSKNRDEGETRSEPGQAVSQPADREEDIPF